MSYAQNSTSILTSGPRIDVTVKSSPGGALKSDFRAGESLNINWHSSNVGNTVGGIFIKLVGLDGSADQPAVYFPYSQASGVGSTGYDSTLIPAGRYRARVGFCSSITALCTEASSYLVGNGAQIINISGTIQVSVVNARTKVAQSVFTVGDLVHIKWDSTGVSSVGGVNQRLINIDDASKSVDGSPIGGSQATLNGGFSLATDFVEPGRYKAEVGFCSSNSTDCTSGSNRFLVARGSAVITINAKAGGYVCLFGSAVQNNGIITAPLGTVALASGSESPFKEELNFSNMVSFCKTAHSQSGDMDF